MSNIPDYGLDRLEIASSATEIKSHEDYERAGEVLVRIATITKKLREGDQEENFPGLDKLVASSREAYEAALKTRNFFLEKCNKLRQRYEQTMEAYRLIEEEKHRKLTAVLESTAKRTRSTLEKEATQAARAGLIDQAAGLMQQRDLIPEKPTLEAPDFRLKNIAQTEEYEITITDPMALLKAIAEGKVPFSSVVMKQETPLVDFRISAIKAAVKSMGDAFDWPGVKVKKGFSYRPRAVSQ